MKFLLALFSFIMVTLVQAQNPVIIELFTSQGCSSCPAADKNLAEIVNQAEANGQQVFGLSFHVDYWNYIGWKDPYSKSEFTERQKNYAAALNSEGIYTPQMIINGKVDFVGSDKKTSAEEVRKALSTKMPIQISIDEVMQTGKKITLTYSLSNPIDGVINLAFVEKNNSNEVTKGENAGRHLSHRNIVRAFTTAKAHEKGTIEIETTASTSQTMLIIYMQNRQWQVIGASCKNL